MPQFTRQTARPLTIPSYMAAARKLRHLADLIEANAARRNPQEKRSLTQAIHGLTGTARSLYRRHSGLAAHDSE